MNFVQFIAYFIEPAISTYVKMLIKFNTIVL